MNKKTDIMLMCILSFCLHLPLVSADNSEGGRSGDKQAVNNLKIAAVDMNKLFNQYYKTKFADINLKKQGDIFKEYARKLFESKMKLEEEFKKLRDASQNIALSEAERESKRLAAQDKYRQLKEKQAELRQYNMEKQKQLKDAYDKERDAIVREIMDVIQKRAILEGYTFVFDTSGKTLNNLSVFLYYSKSIDITDEILKILNRGHEKELERLNKLTEKKKGIQPDFSDRNSLSSKGGALDKSPQDAVLKK